MKRSKVIEVNPLVSIIVPTKNRYTTLIALLDLLRSYESEQFEVVVQDNSDDNKEITAYLNNNIDTRIAYHYVQTHLSIIENCDLGISNSRGEYICMIGDDDAVMPYIDDIAKWMKRNDIEIAMGSDVLYFWPPLSMGYFSKDRSGNLLLPRIHYSIEEQSTREYLTTNLRSGGTRIVNSPNVYQGIVSKSVLDRIFSAMGSYFPGPSPDMAIATALSLTVETYYSLDIPIAISGKAKKSAGGEGTQHKHVGNITDVPHLPKDTLQNWFPNIPAIWTGETIYANTVLNTLKRYGRSDLLNEFNVNSLHAQFFTFHYSLFRDKKVMNTIKTDYIRMSPYILSAIWSRFLNLWFNVMRDIIRCTPNKCKYKNISNISVAVQLLMSKINIEKLNKLIKQ